MELTDVEDIAIVCYEGFDELDAVAPYEVFSMADSSGGELDVRVLALTPTERVTASHGLGIEVDGVLGTDDPDPDLLLVPGGGWNDRSERGAWREVQRGTLPDVIARRHDRGTVVASVCTGSMIVAAAGLLEGRPATTHAGAIDELSEYGAEPVDARVVDDGDVLTAGGVTSGLDLSLWIVERCCGEDVAAEVATRIEYERTASVHVPG